jgi:hypothetical protein
MRHDITQNISFPNINTQINNSFSDLQILSAATNAKKCYPNLLLIQIMLSFLKQTVINNKLYYHFYNNL